MKPLLNCLVYKNNKPISNRTYLKCLLNPLLRVFGLQIATIVENDKIIKNHKLMKIKPVFNFIKGYYISLFEDWGDIQIKEHKQDGENL